MELTEILAFHAKKYPLMQPVDAVKLLYQNEFGGGHLIRDPQMSLNRLRAEYESVPHNDASQPLLEDIGGGMVRLYLTAPEAENYPLEKLNADFVRSSEAHRGNMESFLDKLKLLEAQFDALGFTFSRAALEEYLRDYRAAGCPMVSHSAEYNRAYHPAYRVLCREFVSAK